MRAKLAVCFSVIGELFYLVSFLFLFLFQGLSFLQAFEAPSCCSRANDGFRNLELGHGTHALRPPSIPFSFQSPQPANCSVSGVLVSLGLCL